MKEEERVCEQAIDCAGRHSRSGERIDREVCME